MFVNTASLAGGHLMWMHRFSVIRALRGENVLLREFNRVQEKHQPGRAIARLEELIAAARAWPQKRKEEWAAEIWDSAGLGPVQEFLREHRPYLDVDALRDWTRRGHEVGFHTHSHPFCSQLSDDLLDREVLRPVAELNSAIGVNAMPLAYPFGDRCRPEHEQTLRRSGQFSALIGTAGFSMKPVNPFTLERVEAERGVDREVFARPILRR